MMTVHSNTVYNHNATSGDVACGQEQFAAVDFKAKCGVDVGTSSATLPSDAQISSWVRRWLAYSVE